MNYRRKHYQTKAIRFYSFYQYQYCWRSFLSQFLLWYYFLLFGFSVNWYTPIFCSRLFNESHKFPFGNSNHTVSLPFPRMADKLLAEMMHTIYSIQDRIECLKKIRKPTDDSISASIKCFGIFNGNYSRIYSRFYFMDVWSRIDRAFLRISKV